MTVVFLTSASGSSYSKPGDWDDVGHTVELVGCGGDGTAGSNGAGHKGTGGGGGGGYAGLVRTAGALGSSTSFAVKANNTSTTDANAQATFWQGTTTTNTNEARCGLKGTATGGAGGAGVTNGSPAITYSTTLNTGGSSPAFAGSDGGGCGGGGAAGPSGAGKAGGANGQAIFGGGGGGGGANGGSSTAGSAGDTGGNGGAGGQGNSGSGSGAGGGGGTDGTAGTVGGGGGGSGGSSGTGTVTGGAGGTLGNASDWVQTSNSAHAGAGGGGGGGGAWSVNSTPETSVGGAGGNYGGGGGATGGCRASAGTNTIGVGAGGLIVITYVSLVSLPAGTIRTDLPPPISWYRDWSQNLQQSTFSIAVFKPFSQTDWPLPTRTTPPAAPSWTWWYNLNLVAQDAFPAGQRHLELSQRDYQRSPPSWAWWYNLNLIAQDRLPAGEIQTDRPPPVSWYRDWSQNLQQSTLSIVARPFSQLDWPLPTRTTPPAAPSWAWWYNLSLVAQDQFPSGKAYTDRLPTVIWYRDWSQSLVNATLSITVFPFNQYDWPIPKLAVQPDRFWAWSYNLNLIAQDAFPSGQRHLELSQRDYQRSPPSWAWWYNLNLIAQDRLPAGEIQTDRPPPVSWYRDWSQNLQQSTLSIVFRPFSQFDWPLPTRTTPPAAPSWAWWYNLNLVGKDQFPAGEIQTDRPPPVSWYRDWSQNLQQSTLSVVFRPFSQTDWPLPTRTTPPAAPSWTWWYNLNLVAQDAFPAGQRHLELSQRDYQRSPPSWAWWYNLNLIAQDQFPAGGIRTDRPPPVSWYRDWSQNLLQSTLSVVFRPFIQTDWPLPARTTPPAAPSWTWWYNLNLVGRDAFPAGQRHLELSQRDYQRSPPSWAWWYNLNLIAQDRLPAGKIQTDRPPPVSWYRDWSQNLLQSTLSVVFRPFSQTDWPLPTLRTPPAAPSWMGWYNLNLVGKDQFPSGQRHLELSQRDYQRSPPSWAWWYNLNLIGRDVLPAGKTVYDRPPPVSWYRDWSQNLIIRVVFAQPFNQFDWPLPRDHRRGPPTWTSSYLLTLIGQDRLPVGQRHYELNPRALNPRDPGTRLLTWTLSINLSLVLTAPVGPLFPTCVIYPRPRGIGHPALERQAESSASPRGLGRPANERPPKKC